MADSRPQPDLEPDPRSFVVAAPAEAPVAPPVAPPLDPAGEPVAPAPPPARRRITRKRVLVALGAFVSLVLVLLLTVGFLAWRTYRRIDHVAVSSVLSPHRGGATNYLIVGSDSRAGIAADNPNEAVIGPDTGSARTDTIVVLHVDKQGTAMLPLPRDLWVPIAGTNGKERINTAIQGGPARLIETVQQLGIPVHHYMEVDFSGFLDVVNALGGVTINFDAPAFDESSGLDIKTAGPHKLNGDAALAYVRSRHYTRIVNGKPVEDPTADLGRISRQQTFLREVMRRVGATRNPFRLLRIGDGVAKGLRLDDSMGFRDTIGFARTMRGLDPETIVLPVRPTTTDGGAAVLLLDAANADAALARVRS